MAAAPNDDVDDVASMTRRRSGRSPFPVLTETVLPWIRFVGPGRLLGGLGVALVARRRRVVDAALTYRADRVALAAGRTC